MPPVVTKQVSHRPFFSLIMHQSILGLVNIIFPLKFKKKTKKVPVVLQQSKRKYFKFQINVRTLLTWQLNTMSARYLTETCCNAASVGPCRCLSFLSRLCHFFRGAFFIKLKIGAEICTQSQLAQQDTISPFVRECPWQRQYLWDAD